VPTAEEFEAKLHYQQGTLQLPGGLATHCYTDFIPGEDKVATYGHVAGTLVVKADLFKVDY
jgi:hypothetical protein